MEEGRAAGDWLRRAGKKVGWLAGRHGAGVAESKKLRALDAEGPGAVLMNLNRQDRSGA